MYRFIHVFTLTVVLLILAGCSGRGADIVTPPISDIPAKDSSVTTGGSTLWGFWDIEFDPVSQEVMIIPRRTTEWAYNVVRFVDSSPMYLTINIVQTDFQPEYLDFYVDIGLQHPFPGLDIFTGFDVMGIFLGEGTDTYPGPAGYPVAGVNDPQLLNADGYTRRWNAPEFASAGDLFPIQGYIPGAKGTPDFVPSAVLNPYKYYSDALDVQGDPFEFLASNPDGRGAFSPGSVNHRLYYLRFPTTSIPKFQYAINANWDINIYHPDPPETLDDFPFSANSQEAVLIDVVDTSSAYFTPSTYGGDVIFDISVWDWSAETSTVTEEYVIRLLSDAWVGAATVDMTPTAVDGHAYTYHAEVPIEILTSADPLRVWVEVAYPDYDYTSHVGVPNLAIGNLTNYFAVDVDVSPAGPTGGIMYGLADYQWFLYCNQADNTQFFTNLLNLPLDGPYADNTHVSFYTGRWSAFSEPIRFRELIEGLGYTYEFVLDAPFTPINTDGVKMLVIFTLNPPMIPVFYTPEEVQEIKDLVNGGGICILLTDFPGSYDPYGGTEVVDRLIEDLGLHFTFPNDQDTGPGYYTWFDISPSPETAGVSSIYGGWAGHFLMYGEAVSLIRSPGGYDVLVTTPIG